MRRHMRRIVRRRRQRCLGLESIVDDGEERGEGGREGKVFQELFGATVACQAADLSSSATFGRLVVLHYSNVRVKLRFTS